MKTIELSALDSELRHRLLSATEEPVLITNDEHPLLVVRSLLDDDAADELIAEHPEFIASIRQARQEKSSGKV